MRTLLILFGLVFASSALSAEEKQTAGSSFLIVSPGNKDAQWRPTPAQAETVAKQTAAYFAAKDQGKFKEAYAQLSPGQKKMVAFDRWSELTAKFNEEAGAIRSRTIKTITWYKNPPDAGPGIYAAADFTGRFDNVDIYCGYLVWHEQADGSFLLAREEQNSIPKEVEKKMKPVDLAKFRVQYGC